MKKTFLIGVLAALMLFAFTACEQNMPSTPLYGAQVENITVASQPVYVLDGEGGIFPDIDASKITLNVVFNDGKSIQYTGEDLKMGEVKTYGENMTAPVSFNGKTYYVTLKAYEATSVSYDLSTIEAESFADGVFSTTLTATVTSTGGPVTVENTPFGLDAADIAKIVKDNELKAGNTYTLTADYVTSLMVAKAEAQGATSAEIEEAKSFASYTGSKVLTYANPKTIMYITAEQGNKIYGLPQNSTGGTEVPNTISEAGIVVKAHLADGSELILSEDKSGSVEGVSYDWTIKFIGYETSYVFDDEDDRGGRSISITVKAIAPESGVYANQSFTTTSAHPFNLVISADYPTEFTVSQKPLQAGKTAVKYFYNGEEIDKTNFDFKASKWASNFVYATEEEAKNDEDAITAPNWEMDFVADPTRIPYGTAQPVEEGQTETGATYAVNFNYTVDGTVKTATVPSVKVYTTPTIAAAEQAKQTD